MSAHRFLLATALAAVLSLALAASAQALALAPNWSLSSVAMPTHFKPGDKKGDYFYELVLENTGGAPTDGSDVVLTDTLPAGLSVKDIELRLPTPDGSPGDFGPEACEEEANGEVVTVTCTISDAIAGADEPADVGPSGHLTALIHVTTPPSLLGVLANHTEVSGGGASPASADSQNEASLEAASAGFALWHARISDGEGNAMTAAASRPFQITTTFAVNTNLPPAGSSAAFLPAEGDIKDIEVALPPGLVGNPTVVTHCTPQQFTTIHSFAENTKYINECPDSSAIGVVTLRQLEGRVGGVGQAVGPIYNLIPPKGMPAQFGFQIAGAPIYIDTELRSGSDYGVTARLRNTSQAKRVSSASVTIWGVPADASHDPLRGGCAELGGSCDAEVEPRPFLRMPTDCGPELAMAMNFNIWSDPGRILSAEALQPAPTECAVPDFNPGLEAQPTTSVADSPSGLHLDIHLPQAEHEEDPEGIGEADLRESTVILPEGLVVNPSSAAGLESCSLAQIGYLGEEGGSHRFTPDPPACPDAAKVGKVEVDTPLVDHPLPGAVYLAQQNQNPFGSLLAIYVTVSDPQSGIVVKIPAEVVPNPLTGQMSATAEAPPAPFEDFKLDFFSGPRAPLRTPAACGTYSTTAGFVPWSAPDGSSTTRSDSFGVASGPAGPCPGGGLEPMLSGGLADPTAGASSPFRLRVFRADGTGEFDGIAASPPPGLLAKLKGIHYCGEAEIAQAVARTTPGQGALEAASPSCPAASRIGTIRAGAGAGAAPFYVSGAVYLAGPYKGAPLSLVAVVPALAGPFDLGVVTNRVALRVDPETAQVKAVSDPFPTILSGIPLDLREVRVALDRPDFTIAPTNCAPMAVNAQVTSPSGASALTSDRFQVGACGRLRFAPSLRLKLKGGTQRADNPSLRAELRARPGEANIARTSVALPHSAFLDQEHIGTICTRVQFVAKACPARSVYGFARAWSPLLDQPLEGPVYLRANGGERELPDLVAALDGQIDVDLVGRIDSYKGGIRTSFAAVPDAPVTKFVLRMAGGKRGLLVNSQNICRGTHRATVKMTGQNGKRNDFRPVLHNSCRGKQHKK